MKYNIPSIKFLSPLGLAVLSLIFFTSCFRLKNLQENRYLLREAKVSGQKTLSEEGFTGLFRQKPNSRPVSLLRYTPAYKLWFYDKGYRKFRPDSIANFYVDSSRSNQVFSRSLIKINKKFSEDSLKISQKYNLSQNSSNFVNNLENVEEEDLTSEQKKELRKIVRGGIKYNKLRAKYDEKVRKNETYYRKGNFLMRVMGEPPTYYNSKLTEATRIELEKYMKTQGFFQGTATFKVDTISKKNKTISVKYKVIENEPTLLDSITYQTDNKNIDSLLKKNKTGFLKTKDRYSQSNIDKERARIEDVLQDNGYLHFGRQYVSVEVNIDSVRFQVNHLTDLRIIINNPIKMDTIALKKKIIGSIENKVSLDEMTGVHNSYTIKEVYFWTKIEDNEKIDTTNAIIFPSKNPKNIKYTASSRIFSKKVLNNRIFVKNGDVFSRKQRNFTRSRLANLDMFKFVDIGLQEEKNAQITYYITVIPAENKILSAETGLNVTQNIPGPFLNLSLKNLNPFGGLEIWDNSILVGLDGQTAFTQNTSALRTVQIGLNSSLLLPQFFFPIKKISRKLNKYNPKTTFLVGFNYTNRQPEYVRTNFRTAITYSIIPSEKRTYSLTLLDFNISSTPTKSKEFQAFLDELQSEGNPFFQSFRTALVTSSTFAYTYNETDTKNPNKNQKARYFKVTFEPGGTMLNLIKQKVTTANATPTIFGLNTFKFVRLFADFHYNLPVSKNNKIAWRVFGGAAVPYGGSTTIPYEKFFFAGGSTSMRAFPARRLGSGSYNRIRKGAPDRGEQPGNFILETNLEFRHHIWWFFNGALFADIGNTWALNDNSSRPGADFSKDFYKEFAVGLGYGLRLDFNFLIVRIDAAIKTVDPSRKLGERYVLPEFSFKSPFSGSNGINFVVGIGHPF